MGAGEPHRQAVFELWAGQPQRAACSRLLGQLNPLICQWVISGTQAGKATDSLGQTDKHTVHTYIHRMTHMNTRMKQTFTPPKFSVIKWPVAAHRRALKGQSIVCWRYSENCHGAKAFECSCGLNVLLTRGNRSWPLFPSYRHRQRLCVFMCSRPGHVGTCLYNLYRNLVSGSTCITINKAMQSDINTQSLEWSEATREADQSSGRSSISVLITG